MLACSFTYFLWLFADEKWLRMEIGRPSPSLSFPMTLWCFSFTEGLVISDPLPEGSIYPYLDTSTDVDFVLCWSSPWRSYWRGLNCFRMALLMGKPMPNLYVILYTHLWDFFPLQRPLQINLLLLRTFVVENQSAKMSETCPCEIILEDFTYNHTGTVQGVANVVWR